MDGPHDFFENFSVRFVWRKEFRLASLRAEPRPLFEKVQEEPPGFTSFQGGVVSSKVAIRTKYRNTPGQTFCNFVWGFIVNLDFWYFEDFSEDISSGEPLFDYDKLHII